MKSIDIKKLKKEVKNEKKKENKTMNKNQIIWSTVGATLGTLTTIAAILYAGFTLGTIYQQGITDQVHAEAKVLSASVQKTPSK